MTQTNNTKLLLPVYEVEGDDDMLAASTLVFNGTEWEVSLTVTPAVDGEMATVVLNKKALAKLILNLCQQLDDVQLNTRKSFGS